MRDSDSERRNSPLFLDLLEPRVNARTKDRAHHASRRPTGNVRNVRHCHFSFMPCVRVKRFSRSLSNLEQDFSRLWMMDGIVLSMESIDFGYVDSIKACETDFDDIFVSCCSMKCVGIVLELGILCTIILCVLYKCLYYLFIIIVTLITIIPACYDNYTLFVRT